MDNKKGVASRTRLRNARMLEEQSKKSKRKQQQNATTMRSPSQKAKIVVLDSSSDDEKEVKELAGFADFGVCKSRRLQKGEKGEGGGGGKVSSSSSNRVVEDKDKDAVFEKWRRMNYGNVDGDGSVNGNGGVNRGEDVEESVPVEIPLDVDGDGIDGGNDDTSDSDGSTGSDEIAPIDVDEDVVGAGVDGGNDDSTDSDGIVPIDVDDDDVAVGIDGGDDDSTDSDHVASIDVDDAVVVGDSDRGGDNDGVQDNDSMHTDDGSDSVDDGYDDDEISSSEEDCDDEDDPDFKVDEEYELLSEDRKVSKEKYVIESEGKELKGVEMGKGCKVGEKRRRDGGKKITLDSVEDSADTGDGDLGVKLIKEIEIKRKRMKINSNVNNVIDLEDEVHSIGSNRHSSVYSSEGPTCVARRTRSHSNFAVGKNDRNKSYFDSDDGDLSSGDDGGQGHRVIDKGGSGKLIKHRKKHGHPKGPDFIDIMMRNILETGEEFLEERKSECDVAAEGNLPQKFTYGIDEPIPCEKTDFEKEEDELWSEMALVLATSEIDNNVDTVEDEDSSDLEDETNGLMCCQQGRHEYILDDEIGVRCKFCYFIKTGIKDVMPDFCPNFWGNPQRHERREKDQSFFFGDEDPEIGCSSHAGRNLLPAKGTVWDIIPGVRESMYPHQREGFEFIWIKTAGDIYLQKLKANNCVGGGCIISHAPGTGKTRLTIVFLQTYMKLYPMSRPVIIAPCNMLMTWEEEFRKWNIDIPFHNLNHSQLSDKEDSIAQNLFEHNNVRDVKGIRMLKLYSWKKGNSILGLSYSLFENLTIGRSSKKTKKENEVQYTEEVQKYRRILFELPGILVFDEGHTPRNDQSNIWKAVSEIKTEKRIILSGTPFQNNFRELYNTLCLASPRFEERNQFLSHGVVKKRGRRKRNLVDKYTSLTSSIRKDGESLNDRLKELRSMICPFVNVHKGTILQESLPGLNHTVVVLHPTKMQDDLLRSIEGSDYLTMETAASLVSVHSSLYLYTKFHKAKKLMVNTELLEKLRLNPDGGVKTKFLIELIRLSKALNERVLVFSQFLGPLTLIRDQLTSYFDWSDGKEVLYMYGKQDLKLRQSFIDAFNDEGSEARVLLASTKACREGISLVGASRVVLLDVVWNPSVEWQAISRAYRLGQKKFVYAYSLIAAGTGTKEAEKYQRQAEKDQLSKLVFSSSDGDRDKEEISKNISKDKILEEISQHQKLESMFAKIIPRPKESNLEVFGSLNL